MFLFGDQCPAGMAWTLMGDMDADYIHNLKYQDTFESF
jgi:hypothetical protein